jgi:hypothetical protein
MRKTGNPAGRAVTELTGAGARVPQIVLIGRPSTLDHEPQTGGPLVNKLTLAVGIAALVVTSACKKTGEGEYEVQKPTLGTTTDTVSTPSVETGTVKDTIDVPKVTTEKKEVTVPKVDVKTPDERKQ